ncbi:hypothetical protein ACJJTC_016547 [Scirpophaga incertulas]
MDMKSQEISGHFKNFTQVCAAIINALKDNVKIPGNSRDWKNISDDFNNLWNFPHCVGAIDGKHVLLQAPFNSGTEYFNYKSTYSIVLFAMVDANYNILFADAGCQGRISDGGVFKNSKLHDMIENNTLQLPTPVPLQGRNKQLPYFILGDSAFALSENVMKPYPEHAHAKGSKERIFNYRLVELGGLRTSSGSSAAKEFRNELAGYFTAEGRLSWQDEYA